MAASLAALKTRSRRSTRAILLTRAIVIEPSPDLIGPDGRDAHAVVFVADGVLEQIERIDVRRMPKQHTVSVALAPRIGGDRPGAVKAGDVEPI